MSSATTPERHAPRSLAARLTAWYAGSAFLLILLATGALYVTLSAHLDEEQDELLADKVRILTVLVNKEDLRGLKQELEWEWEASRHARIDMRVLDAAGKTLLETPGMAERLPVAAFPPPGDAPAVVAGYRVTSHASDGRVLQLGLNRSEDDRLLRDFRRALVAVLLAAPAACALVGYRVARRGLRPIADVSATAARINASTLGERIGAAGMPAELAELAATFDAMLVRLEDAFGRATRFSADIAHELRTPLHVLRGEVEVALSQARTPEEYREVLGSCLEQCARLAKLVDTLLFLSRADNPEAEIVREPLDVGAELSAAVGFYEPIAADTGVALTADAPAGLTAALDRTLFQRALGNLVANALAHTPAGGRVTVRAVQQPGAMSVEVADTGEGIAAEHMPFVFDRFYRADGARTTNGRVGLGLALVKSVAALHGGTVAAESTLGRGTCVRLVFPDTK